MFKIYRMLIATILSTVLVTQAVAQTPVPSVSIKGTKNELNMISSVTMVGIGLVAQRLYTYKPMPVDVMIAAAAGAAYLYSEISSTEQINDQEITLDKDGKTDNVQYEALQELKTKLEKARKGIETKKKIQTIAAAAFAAAAAAAIIEKLTVTKAQTACMSATQFAADLCTSVDCPGNLLSPTAAVSKSIFTLDFGRAADAAVLGNSIQKYSAFSAKLSARAGLVGSQATSLVNASPACLEAAASCGLPPAIAACELKANTGIALCKKSILEQEKSCQLAIAEEEKSQARKSTFIPWGINIPHAKNLYYANNSTENKINPKFFERLLNFVIPPAKAGMGEILFGAGGAAAGYFFAKTMEEYLDTYLFAPGTRAVAWGILGGLAGVAAKSSHDTAQEITENIKKIEGIQAALSKNEKSIRVKGGVTAVGISTPSLAGYAVSTPNGEKIECVLNAGVAKCRSVVSAMTSSPQWATLSPGVQAAANAIGTLTDGYQGTPGISNRALDTASGSLDASSTGVRNAIKNGKVQVNGLLSKLGAPKMDFEKAEGNFLKDLNKTTENALKKAGTTPKGFLSSIGSSSGFGSASPGTSPAKADLKTNKSAAITSGPLSEGASRSGSDFNPGNLEDSAIAENPVPPTEEASNVDQRDDFAWKNEINKNKDTSIFDLISNRYMKSYEKLFNRVKE